MTNITDVAINCCPYMMIYPDCNFNPDVIFEQFCERNTTVELTSYQRVYIGVEFCNNVIAILNKEKILKLIERIYLLGKKVSLVIPPLSEHFFSSFFLIIDYVIKNDAPFDEIIFNDFGSILYFINLYQGINKKIIAGRLFDKGIREGRFDVYKEYPDFSSLSELHCPQDVNKELVYLWNNFHISGIETDSIPDGVLNIENLNFSFHVHYPRIIHSVVSHCEFSGIGVPPNRKFVLSDSCGHQCQKFAKMITTNQNRIFYKIGNAILSKQNQSISQSISGVFRLICSDINYSKHNGEIL